MAQRPIAALDIGIARIGVAISNPERTVALAHGTIHLNVTPNPYEEIAQFLAQNHVKTVVYGWPLELDGTEGPAIRRTKRFIVELKRTCPDIRCIPQDERLTSSAAENALQEMETRGSRKKDFVDAMAACLILQTYLERAMRR